MVVTVGLAVDMKKQAILLECWRGERVVWRVVMVGRVGERNGGVYQLGDMKRGTGEGMGERGGRRTRGKGRGECIGGWKMEGGEWGGKGEMGGGGEWENGEGEGGGE